jgi:hypothetical protein
LHEKVQNIYSGQLIILLKAIASRVKRRTLGLKLSGVVLEKCGFEDAARGRDLTDPGGLVDFFLTPADTGDEAAPLRRRVCQPRPIWTSARSSLKPVLDRS